MKKICTLLTCILMHQLLSAQSWQWAINAAPSNFSHAAAIKKDHAGNIYVATNTDSSGITLNARIEKRDAQHAVVWSHEFPGGPVITDAEINSQNHVIVMGYFTGDLTVDTTHLQSPGKMSAFLAEYFDDGSVFWARMFNPTNSDFQPGDLFIDRFDELFLTAQLINSLDHGFCSFHKLNVWGQPLLDEFNDDYLIRTFSHVLTDSTGNVYLSGTCSTNSMFDGIRSDSVFSYQNFLVKYDLNFNAQWLHSRKYVTFDDNNGLGYDGQSLYWCFNEAATMGDTVRLVKTNTSGVVQQETAAPLALAFFPSITFATDDAGNSVLAENVFNSIYVYRFDEQLNLVWSDTIAASVSGFPGEVRVSCYDSSFYLCSKYYADTLDFDSQQLINPISGIFGSDVFVAEWKNTNTVGINDLIDNSIISIYPNPVNDKIHIHLSKALNVHYAVYDLTGKECTSGIMNNQISKTVDVKSLSEGIYILKISGENSAWTKKFVIGR